MKKIIKLNESDLLRIIKSVISEQGLGRSIPSDFEQDITPRVRVINIQRKLKELGYDLGSSGPNRDGIDGVYGRQTKLAVRNFQIKNKLNPDGIVGPKTAQVLGVNPLLKGGLSQDQRKKPQDQPKKAEFRLWPGLKNEYKNQITKKDLENGKLPEIQHKGCGGFLNQISIKNISRNAWTSYYYMPGTRVYSAFDQLDPNQYLPILNKIKERPGKEMKDKIKDNQNTDENEQLRKIVGSLNGYPSKNLQLGDRVGIFYEPSEHYEKALVQGKTAATFGKPTFNTHTGIVGAIDETGKPIVFHSIKGQEIADPADDLKIVWVKR